MKLFAAALATLLIAAPAAAQTAVKLARAQVLMPPGEWVMLPPAAATGLSVIDRLRIEAETQTAFLVQDGAIRAWVEVTATPRTFGYPLELSNICLTNSTTLWSVPVEEGNPLDLQCVSASAPLDAAGYLEDRPALVDAAQARGLTLPKQFVFASGYMLRQKGLLMSIDVYAEPSFVGDAKNLPKSMPWRVSPQHGAYAMLLMARVRDCLYSIRCAVDLPPLSFAEAVAAAPAPSK
jgi:hypothetical protein